MLSDKKLICLVTGASQNCGYAIAHELALLAGKGSKVILSTRNRHKLLPLLHKFPQNVSVSEVEWSLDPAKDDYRRDLDREITEEYEVAAVVHNAYMMGDLSVKVEDMSNYAEVHRMFDVNVTSMILINAAFQQKTRMASKRLVIHLSAGSANVPLSSVGLPGSCRAARQMILNVMRLESPEIKVLHFEPGFADTEGLRALRDDSHDPEMRDWISNLYAEEGKLLAPAEIAKRLARLVDRNEFGTGDIVSAFDV